MTPAAGGLRGRRRILVQVGLLGAASALAFGCGSSESSDQSQRLPRDLGADLAEQSDAVRSTLEHGDGCKAKEQAEQLQASVTQAISNGEVPPELQPELRRRADDLAGSIVCDEPPPPQPQPPPQTEGYEGDD